MASPATVHTGNPSVEVILFIAAFEGSYDVIFTEYSLCEF
jgi:hypothetical protein